MKDNQGYMNSKWRRLLIYILPIFIPILIASTCQKTDGPTPQLELKEGDYYVDCVKIYLGAIGGTTGALHLKGYIKNLSPFRVELNGSYKGSDTKVYTSFADHYNNFRPTSKIYLDAGKEISGSIMYIHETDSYNTPSYMAKQTKRGFFRVTAYPVDDNDQRFANGNEKNYVISVPEPEGFIEDMAGSYQCPCFSIPECGDQTQPVHGRDGW